MDEDEKERLKTLLDCWGKRGEIKFKKKKKENKNKKLETHDR